MPKLLHPSVKKRFKLEGNAAVYEQSRGKRNGLVNKTFEAPSASNMTPKGAQVRNKNTRFLYDKIEVRKK